MASDGNINFSTLKNRESKLLSGKIDERQYINNYKINSILSYNDKLGYVYLCTDIYDKKYVIKKIFDYEFYHNEISIIFKLEKLIMEDKEKTGTAKIRIAKLVQHFKCGKIYYIVQNYIESCNLCDFMSNDNYNDDNNQDNPNNNLKLKIDMIKQIVEGVSFLHNNNIAHCDIKLDNILIDKNNLIYLIDYGFSKCVSPDETPNYGPKCGTPEYVAPEIAFDIPYTNKASDIWSLGIVIYVILTNYFPFSYKEYLKNKLTIDNFYENYIKKYEYYKPEMLPEFVTILKSVLTYPFERITINDLEKSINDLVESLRYC